MVRSGQLSVRAQWDEGDESEVVRWDCPGCQIVAVAFVEEGEGPFVGLGEEEEEERERQRHGGTAAAPGEEFGVLLEPPDQRVEQQRHDTGGGEG